MIGPCPLCGSAGVEHPATHQFIAGASCSNHQCILHENSQDETNKHVRLEQWPKPCVFECREEPHGSSRGWCQVHGFDCPSIASR